MSQATPLHDRGSLADDRPMMPRGALPGQAQTEGYRQVRARAGATVQWTRAQA